MNQNRSCKKCKSPLCDMDPHTICKTCRQPDPQMFYCSEEDCEACSVIKVFEPLDQFLRKQELDNLQKKLNQFTNQQPKSDRPNYSKKKSSALNYLPHREMEMGNKLQLPDLNSELFNSVLKGMGKDKGDSNVCVKDNFTPSISGMNKLENLKELEKRLYDRVMSSLMSSFDNKNSLAENLDTKRSQPENANPSQSLKTSRHASPSLSTSSSKCIDLDKDEGDLLSTMSEFLEEYFPESISKVNKGTNDGIKSEMSVKISSRASDILSKGTILCSPQQASKIRSELKLESGMLYWPLNLNAADVLHSNHCKLPNMKVHPKIRHLHSVLFGKLNPSLPSELLGDNFTLPDITLELKNEFFFAREQLQRLLLIFSLLDNFTVEKVVQENTALATLCELLLNYLKLCMEKQANFVGLLVQEMRKDLLCDAECKIPDAVSKLIMGPIHQSQFFGSYVYELKEIIEKNGSSYCLYSKSEKSKVKLYKLPSKFKEGDSVEKFLISMRVFFETNSTPEKDKISILENLLPDEIIERISNFIKPNKICETSFEELVPILKKFDSNISSDILIERSKFLNTKQNRDLSVKDFAEQLKELLPRCMYGLSAREMLRDQFVFGLYNSKIQQNLLNKFSWCFEECLTYTIQEENKNKEKSDNSKIRKEENKSNDSKNSQKRKWEDSSEKEAVKKPKIPEVKESFFYFKPSSKNSKIISVHNLQQWNHYFGFDVQNSYEVYCPWTGQILRS
ncbi:UNVERIFIED_CONTAM: hypothetical protein RMT77_001483 [Armadillidium vulgare]